VHRSAVGAFGVLAVIWGSNFVYMKMASETLSPGQVTFGRVLFGFLPVAVFAAAKREMARAHLRYAHHFLVMSLLATSLYYFAFASAAAVLPSAIAGALSGAIPLFSFLATAIFLRAERITWVSAAGVAIGFAGVLLIARPWAAAGSVDTGGVMAMVLGSASIGFSFVYARKYVAPLGIPASALTTYQMGFGLVSLALVTDFDGITAIRHDLHALLGLVIGLGLLGTGVAYLLYYFIVTELGAVTASSATYLPPVVAMLIGWLLVGESITVLDVAGVGAILSGVILLRQRTPSARPA
jgi:drug/metabolite transporter (DMT)-like permease